MTPLERSAEIQAAVNVLLTEVKESMGVMSVSDSRILYRRTREISDQLTGIRVLLDPTVTR